MDGTRMFPTKYARDRRCAAVGGADILAESGLLVTTLRG